MVLYDMIRDLRRHDHAMLETHRAQWVLLELQSRTTTPSLQAIPSSIWPLGSWCRHNVWSSKRTVTAGRGRVCTPQMMSCRTELESPQARRIEKTTPKPSEAQQPGTMLNHLVES